MNGGPAARPLSRELGDYLALRRALGYQLSRPEKLLGQFLDHLGGHGESTITITAALEWAQLPAGAANWHAYRLGVVRGFAAYVHQLDPHHEVPPAELLPQHSSRACPYLYSDAQIAALIDACESLSSPLRRATFATLIGLLAATGIRIGEAIALDRDDLDHAAGMLRVRHGKFDKQRQIPLHPTSLVKLRQYAGLRDRLAPARPTTAMFLSTVGTRLLYCNVHTTWKRLVERAGVKPRSSSCRPRIHDLRHSYTVRSMLEAYAAGQDGQRRLTLLSTWLGHVDPGNTYWYLTASPELMAVAGQRLENYLAGGRP